MPQTVRDLMNFLESFAPARLAEDWDNVGLLAGDPAAPAERVMTCLTVTPETAAEAVRERADLIVTHHPLPFRPLKRITTDHVPGQLLWQLIRHGIGIYSPHTAFDSAARGINQQLAEGLRLRDIHPLEPCGEERPGSLEEPAAEQGPELGAGRWGTCDPPRRLAELAEKVMSLLAIDGLHRVGAADRTVTRVAVACGAAGSFLDAARRADCQVLLTGETNFHTCLEAEATGVSLLLPGHFASERFAVEKLAEVLHAAFSEITVWAARDEQDPLRWMPSA